MHILLLQQSNHFNHYPEGYQEHVALKTTHLEKEGGFKSEPERSWNIYHTGFRKMLLLNHTGTSSQDETWIFI